MVAGAMLAAVVPLLGHGLPGLTDLPNNVARLQIQAHCGAGEWYAAFYAPNSLAIPNAAFDLFGWALGGVLTPIGLGHLFAVLAVILTTTGAAALASAFGHGTGLAAVFAAATAHNFASTSGFLNYTAGLGLALWAAWLWLRMRRQRFALRWIAGSLSTLVLYFCHLFALGTYAAILLGFELGGNGHRRRRVLFALATLAPAVGLALSSPLGGEARAIEWATLAETLRACAKSLHGGLGIADYWYGALLATLAVGLALTGRLRVTRPARIALVGLVVATLLCPESTFEASGLQARMPVAVAVVASASMRWRHRRGPRWVVPALAIVVLGTRTATLTLGFAERAAAGGRAARVLEHVPNGACLYTFHRVGPDPWQKYHSPIKHAPCLVALDREVFLPQILVADHHHTLRARSGLPMRLHQHYEIRAGFVSSQGFATRIDELAALWRSSRAQRSAAGLTGGLYLAVVHGGDDLALPLDRVERVAGDGEMLLLRLRE